MVKWTREPSGSCLTFSPCTHPLQSSAPGTLANTPFRRHRATSLWRGGEGLSGVPRGNLVAPCRADSHSPKPSGLALQWASPHRSLPCGIPPAFWPGGEKLLFNVQCQLEVNRFFSQEKIMLRTGWGAAVLLNVPLPPLAATQHWSTGHWPPGRRSSGHAHWPQPVGPRPVRGW